MWDTPVPPTTLGSRPGPGRRPTQCSLPGHTAQLPERSRATQRPSRPRPALPRDRPAHRPRAGLPRFGGPSQPPPAGNAAQPSSLPRTRATPLRAPTDRGLPPSLERPRGEPRRAQSRRAPGAPQRRDSQHAPGGSQCAGAHARAHLNALTPPARADLEPRKAPPPPRQTPAPPDPAPPPHAPCSPVSLQDLASTLAAWLQERPVRVHRRSDQGGRR